MYDSAIFDGINFFSYASLDKNPPLWICLIFGKKMPKGYKVGLISFTIWRVSRDYSIKKNRCVRNVKAPPCGPWTKSVVGKTSDEMGKTNDIENDGYQ